jgi:hypothetical protein
MKKLLFTVIILGFFVLNTFAQVKTINNTKNITKVNDSTIVLYQKAVTPPHNFFYIHDSGGKLVTTFNPGDVVTYASLRELWDRLTGKAPPKQNCFKVACPDGAPSDAVCWDCKPAN